MIEWIDKARRFVGILLVISTPPAVLYWFVVHPFIEFWRQLGTRATFWIVGTLFLAAATGLYFIRHFLLMQDLGASIVTAVAGLPLVITAAVIGIKRKKYLTFRILAGAPEVAGERRLLNEGIYNIIRHPRYLEFMVGCTGWALLINYVGVYLMTAFAILAILVIVPLEERELCNRLGQQYVDYCARVPRFLPRLRR